MKAFLFGLIGRLSPWLHRVLSENNGNPSCSRLTMFGWNALVAAVWLVDCVIHRHMVGIDGSVLAALGIANGTKLGNKFGEPGGPPAA